MKKVLLALIVSFTCLTTCSAADYAKEVRKCVQKTLGNDFKSYQYLSAPIDHFGTGTMYPRAAKDAKFDIKTAGLFGDPETWWTSADEQKITQALTLLRPSGGSGAIAATCDMKSGFSLSAVLPSLANLLSVNAGIDYKKDVKVQISFSTIENRLINWSALASDDRMKLINSDVSAHLGSHDFLITIGDVVLHDYTAQLTITKSLDVKAKAQVTAAWKAFAKDSSLTADFSAGEDGTFKLTAKNPVVAALYVGEPPAGVSLEALDKKSLVPIPLSVSVLADLTTAKASNLKPKP